MRTVYVVARSIREADHKAARGNFHEKIADASHASRLANEDLDVVRGGDRYQVYTVTLEPAG